MSTGRHHRPRHWLGVAVVVAAVVGLLAASARSTSSAGASSEEVAAADPERIATGSAGWVTLERAHGDGPQPVLLHVPGGGWASVDPSPVGAAFGHDRALARGWTVATVGYPTGADVTAADQAAAVAATLRWARSGEAKAAGLGGPVVAAGHSAGAHLLSLATADTPPADRPDALVLVAGVYDLDGDVLASPLLGQGLASALGCGEGRCPASADLEPRRLVDAHLPATVVVHGRDDRVTPAAGSERYAAALAAAGVPTELRLVDGGRHRGQRTDAAVRGALVDVLDQASATRSRR